MYKIQPVIDHIEKVYGLELTTCSIPSSHFQYFKRIFYLFIYNKVSQRLFYFLRDNISNIKYLKERPNGEIWFNKRNSEGKISFEVEIIPISPEACVYLSEDSDFFNIVNNGNYKVTIYNNQLLCIPGCDPSYISFPLNHINGAKQVDYYFSKDKELKKELRDYKLKNVLK